MANFNWSGAMGGALFAGVSEAVQKQMDADKKRAAKFKSDVEYADRSGLIPKDRAIQMRADELDGAIKGAIFAQESKRQQEDLNTRLNQLVFENQLRAKAANDATAQQKADAMYFQQQGGSGLAGALNGDWQPVERAPSPQLMQAIQQQQVDPQRQYRDETERMRAQAYRQQVEGMGTGGSKGTMGKSDPRLRSYQSALTAALADEAKALAALNAANPAAGNFNTLAKTATAASARRKRAESKLAPAGAAAAKVPPDHAAYLKAHPEKRASFVQQYGEEAAAAILGE